MKIAIVTLLLGLGICVGLLALQHRQYSMQFDRQNQAIALVQSRYDASQQENRTLRMAMEAKAHTRAALLQAVPISARYHAAAAPQKRTALR